jgi:hypothetical protein
MKHPHMSIIDICRAFHPTTMQYTLYSAAHGTFSKIDQIVRHKASINIFKKIEMPPV